MNRAALLRIGIFLLAGAPFIVNAAAGDITTAEDVVIKIICPIFRWMFVVFMAVGVMMLIWVAYLYLSSSGESEKVHEANRALLYVVVAFAVGFLSLTIPSIVSTFLQGPAVSVCST